MAMIGVAWPIEELSHAPVSDTDLWTGLLGFALLIAFGAIVLWRGRHVGEEVRPELRIERPAELRKAA